MLRILIQATRSLEASTGCRFAPDVIPAAMDMTRRYERHAAFPGKAVDLLGQLAVRHKN